MMTSRSLATTLSLGMKSDMPQNIMAAPMQRVAIQAMGDTQLSSKSLVMGTPKPNMRLAINNAP